MSTVHANRRGVWEREGVDGAAARHATLLRFQQCCWVLSAQGREQARKRWRGFCI